MWKFTREDSIEGTRFSITSSTRTIALSGFQFDGFVHKTILTLSVEEYLALQSFYCEHQDTLRAINIYEHLLYQENPHLPDIYEKVLNLLPPTTALRLNDAGILYPTNYVKPFNVPLNIPLQTKLSQLGWVYLMADPAVVNTPDKTIKIGYSNNPSYREGTLQAEKPSIELITAWEGTYDDESTLHRLFKDKRLRGEWFRLNDDDVVEIHNYFDGREVWQ